MKFIWEDYEREMEQKQEGQFFKAEAVFGNAGADKIINVDTAVGQSAVSGYAFPKNERSCPLGL